VAGCPALLGAVVVVSELDLALDIIQVVIQVVIYFLDEEFI